MNELSELTTKIVNAGKARIESEHQEILDTRKFSEIFAREFFNCNAGIFNEDGKLYLVITNIKTYSRYSQILLYSVRYMFKRDDDTIFTLPDLMDIDKLIYNINGNEIRKISDDELRKFETEVLHECSRQRDK